ncbi:collagen-binding domain-containing protein [Coraliomargarita algicola]|uniref:Collagen-binding domain-containing protein n=1 Tax=Coraliomargarita algicola TaxID=3092156 RepID=A0ABZ0RIB5_9BACT|nr:collagen-binding domain-containing protein [Coraliomargarita sp. J2-16]WPJ95807.1 collagen-binding domain-containing protein [Coraliomargarita sp. J2-16]
MTTKYSYFLRKYGKLTYIALASSLAAVISGNASTLDLPVADLLTKYNMVALGDYTTTAHTEGRFIVYGSTYGSVSGAPNTLTVTPPDESVIVAGSVNGNMTINSGNVRISTNGVNAGVILTNQGSMATFSNGKRIQVNSGGKVILDPDMDISSSAQEMKAFAVNVGKLINDSGASLYVNNQGDLVGNLVDSNADGLVVVNMAFDQLTQISNNNDKSLLSQLAAVDGVVVNITGTPTGAFKNDGWNDTFASKMLFNFVDATAADTITIGGNGKFWGSILAPEANINSVGNIIEGVVVANNIETGGQELHLPALDTNFTEKLVAAVPEPTTYALIFGFSALIMVAMKRRV